ncbi:DUF4129 domain-containing protein [Lacipirellula parvula]|uniref:Protein-glutamine gamma-glutamyltransferase-like C-terminal domain-containing protein n=1 Tax=Lacipirellula parvula TaxID=2650471 RepID=A0A5K7XFA7_9BACT|nr:DUF4129 domain-containing protein [Lacipirellula parvula]BBO34682.1 hypothetical protein PLANPX_4294 [Lacipirellula parvula]
MPSATLPAAEEIRSSARLILERPEFQVETAPPGGSELVRFLEWTIELLLAPFRWLFNAMDGLPELLRWIIVFALAGLLILLLGHIFYTFATVLRPSTRRRTAEEILVSDEQRPADFEKLADAAAAERDYIGAIRCLFRAALLSLQQREQRRLRPGITNRELLARLRDPQLRDSLRSFVEVIDAGWYGRLPCGAGEYHRCREAYQSIRAYSEAKVDA